MFCAIRNVRSIIPTKKGLNSSGQYARHRAIHYLSSTEWPANLFRSRALTHCILKRSAYSSPHKNQDPLLECETLYPLNDFQINDITCGDPTLVTKLRAFQMELAVQSVQFPGSVPKTLTLEHWKRALPLTRTERRKYLAVLTKKERSKISFKNVDDELFADLVLTESNSIFDYKLFRNAVYPMLHDNVIGDALNRKLAQAVEFSPTVIMDCDFERIMSLRDINNTAQQIGNAMHVNRTANDPFNMIFCNLHKNSMFYKVLWTAIPTISEENMPLVTTNRCYMDMFPKERLVYLTPHCQEEVVFDPKDVYVIGAMVDKRNPGPHSMIKAKIQGIRMASFPLDKYLLWRCGTKSLTLNQVMKILIQLKDTGDWSKAFEAVPQRKVALRNDEILSFKKRFCYNWEERPRS